MIQIKVINETYDYNITSKVNAFLKENDGKIEIIKIDYRVTATNSYGYNCVMITYRVIENV